MIPEGKYRARGCEGTLANAGSGNAQVAVDLEITEEGSEHAGQHRTWYGSFSEKALDRTLNQLRLLGWEGDNLADLSGIGDRDVWVTIIHEDDLEGNPRDRAAWINGSPGLAVKEPMTAGDAAAFAERMKGHVIAHSQRTKGTPASARPVTAANGSSKGKRPAAGAGTAKPQRDFAPEPGAAATEEEPF